MDGMKLDRLIVQFFDAIGPSQLADDSGKAERYIKSRATRLRNSGTWQVLERLDIAERKLYAEYFEALGIEHFIEIDEPYSGPRLVE